MKCARIIFLAAVAALCAVRAEEDDANSLYRYAYIVGKEIIYLNKGVKVIRTRLTPQNDRSVEGDFEYSPRYVPSEFKDNHFYKITIRAEIQTWSYEETKNLTGFQSANGTYFKRIKLFWKPVEAKSEVTPENLREQHSWHSWSDSLGYGIDIRNIRITITDKGTKWPKDFQAPVADVLGGTDEPVPAKLTP